MCKPAVWIWRECGEMDQLRLPGAGSDLRGMSQGPVDALPMCFITMLVKPKVPDG